jgi:hypothetical protein
MGTIDFFVLTETESAMAMNFNGNDVAIDPRAVDNVSPGVGVNLNDAAMGYGPGDPVALTGKYVAPKRIVDDPEYHTYAPGMIVFLLTLPWCSLETETIFAPFDLD